MTQRSRVFDPTYVPTKAVADLANEMSDNPGIKMLAQREEHLTVRPFKTPAGAKMFGAG